MYYYTSTQLKGSVTIDGQKYEAYIADTKKHDADYTNDGISVDIDQDGKFQIKTEYFKPGSIAQINNKSYKFKINW